MRTDRETRVSQLSSEKLALLERRFRGEALPGSTGATIERRPAGAPVPLSFAQQRMWFLDQLVPGNPFYNMATGVRVRGPLDVGALAAAVNEVVRRHESLRTTFQSVDGEPVQVVAPPTRQEVAGYDLRPLSHREREAALDRLVAEEPRRPFDLAAGPLLRVGVAWLGPADFAVLITVHHIVADGWSMEVLSRELGALYVAFCDGRPSPLPDLTIQYGDFAVWQRRRLSGTGLDDQLAYWRRALDGMTPLALPTDRPRPAVQTHAGASVALSLPAETTAHLAAVAREERATLFMVLLAAFGVLLGRYTDQDDVVVGSPIANRNRSELEALIGFFVNSLVLRVDLGGDPTFVELLRRVRQMALGAYAHQDLPFEKLVEELAPARDLARNPLFQVTFQLYASADPQAPAPVDGIVASTGTALFDLRLDLRQGPSGFTGRFEYSTDLFDEATVRAMADRYSRLVTSIAADPHAPIGSLEWLADGEHDALVARSAQPAVAVPDASVHDLVSASASRPTRAPSRSSRRTVPR